MITLLKKVKSRLKQQDLQEEEEEEEEEEEVSETLAQPWIFSLHIKT